MLLPTNVDPPFLELVWHSGGEANTRRDLFALLRWLTTSFPTSRVTAAAVLREADGDPQAWFSTKEEVHDDGRPIVHGTIHLDGVSWTRERRVTVELERSTVLVRCHAGLFCGADGAPSSTKRFRVGAEIARCFVDISKTLSAAYGALLIENPLQSPEELVANPSALTFADCWVSSTILHRLARQRLAQITEGAYREDFDEGVYVSTSPWFNPEKRRLEDAERWEQSTKISRLVGKLALAPQFGA